MYYVLCSEAYPFPEINCKLYDYKVDLQKLFSRK